MKALIVNNHSLHIDHVGEIQRLLSSLGYSESVQIPREELAGVVTDSFDLIFLSGVSGVNAFPVMGHELELTPEMELVRSWNKPLIGVCYGCQILGRTFGAELEPLSKPLNQEIVTVVLTKEGANILAGKPVEYTVYSSRKNYMVSVPDNFVVLAESEYGPEIIVHTSKPYVGVMFHPEHAIEGNHGAELLVAVFTAVMNR